MMFEVTGCDCQMRKHQDSLGQSLGRMPCCCPVRSPFGTESILPLGCWPTTLASSSLQELPLAEESHIAQGLALLEKGAYLHLNFGQLRKAILASQILVSLSDGFVEIVSQFKFSLWSCFLPLPFFILRTFLKFYAFEALRIGFWGNLFYN